MKPILLGIATIGVVGAVTYFVPSTSEVVKAPEVNIASSTPDVVVEEVDVVEEATRELERINAELDAEESRLLEEREQIDARLEKIIKTRQSFI